MTENATAIDAPTQDIARHHKRWERNRAVIEGEDAIKSGGQIYLPKLPTQSDAQYASYVASVDYFPAAQRSLETYIGLIFRKEGILDATDAARPYLDTITARYGLNFLARHLLRETALTNFTGLLVDYPNVDGDVSAALAFEKGRRPFLAPYPAESILEVKQEIVRGRFALTRVRLLDDEKTVRELVLNEGVYQIIMHRKTQSGWVADAPHTPLASKLPLTEIPFEIVSTEAGCLSPPKAMMDDIAAMNLSHYRASAELRNVLRHIGNPVPWVAGVPFGTDENGKPVAPEMSTSVDQVWLFSDPQTKAAYLEHSGAGVASLRQNVLDIEEHMAAVGTRVLAREKAAAEAAETKAIRNASENSILAAFALRVSSQIESQVNRALAWDKVPPISYTLNVDFLPMPMDPAMMTALLALVQSGRISQQTFHAQLQQGEIIDAKRTYEDERDLIAQDVADRPPVDTGF